jgi:cbb3-type cytochrome oxidase subunit 3
MSVIPLTLFFSLLLAGTFVYLFAREQRRRFGSAERDSLLPLADEQPRAQEVERFPAPVGPLSAHDHDHDDHDHDAHTHADRACGCRDGTRPPCVGCLKQLHRAAPAPLS